jgi:cytochrome c-type biogenesis protein CcmF
MLTALAYLTLALAFLLAIYGLIGVIWGLLQKDSAWIKSARLALFIIFPLVSFSLIIMLILLLSDRFDVAYVYSVTSREMPAYLKFTALWGGQSGSLLFWSWLLVGFSAGFSVRKWREEQNLLAWFLLVVFISLAFFLMLNVFFEIPFERFWLLPGGGHVLSVFQSPGAKALIPRDGQGLNPLLRHPGMIWHPPTLYLGFVGYIIPFALVFATLAAGRKDQDWFEIARPWVLMAWVFLTLGLVLGMRWAYDVLGWGGYWGWDPVEIAALLPWLSGTAFLHTALLQKRHHNFKRWNMVLVILTFGLIIFGTFITRSGVVSSVHAFAGSDIGIPMLLFTLAFVLGSVGLFIYRWKDLSPAEEFTFAFSREVLILFSNLVFLSILAVCFVGMLYPIFSEFLTGVQYTVGPAWYERINGPLFMLLLFLVGICPLAAWGGTSLKRLGKRLYVPAALTLLIPFLTLIIANIKNLYLLFALWLAAFSGLLIFLEYIYAFFAVYQRSPRKFLPALWEPIQRNHRRYGGLLVHLGVVLMSLGIIGLEGLQQEVQGTLAIGENIRFNNYQFSFEEIKEYRTVDERIITEALVDVSKNDAFVGSLTPQRQIYLTMGLAITQPSVKSNLARDVYAILVDWEPAPTEEATFRFYINPLVNWLWLGTAVLTLGTILAFLPISKKTKNRN